jgi:hypothetical protein
MAKHIYTGYVSTGYYVESDTELTDDELVSAVADYINAEGLNGGCDLGDIDHQIEEED